LSDLAFVERFVPRQGFIVDLGCGHGLFACLLREAAESRRVLGIDLDERKIEVARGAVRDTQWLRFEVGDIIKDPPPHCDAVTIVDVLYLLPFEDRHRIAMRRRVLEGRKSTRLNSSHVEISYAGFCLQKKKSRRWLPSSAAQSR